MNKKVLLIVPLILCCIAGFHSKAEELDKDATVQSQQTVESRREAAMEREDLNIVFAVDHSGSMSGQDAQRLIPQVLKIFLDTIHGENVHVGYVAYNDTIVAQHIPVSIQMDSQRDILKQTIDSANNQGETDIGLGLKEAYHLMDGCDGRKMIVLLSDGETDLALSGTGRTEEESERDIEEIVALCKEEGTPIVTIAFGGKYDGEEAGLERISGPTGGESYEARSSEELVSILYDLFHTNLSYSVREVSNSVYDGGNQRVSCMTDGIVYDELSVLFFSDKEIKAAGIICGENETVPRIMGNYAVAGLIDSGKEISVRFETQKGQHMTVFLIGRRNITPVVEFNGEIHKNTETAFSIYFTDADGRRLDIPSDHEGLQWHAQFQNIENGSLVPVQLEMSEAGLLGYANFHSAGRYCLYLDTGRNSENTYEVSEINVLNNLPEDRTNTSIEIGSWMEDQVFDLNEYFADADGDELDYELQELPQEIVSVAIKGNFLHITPHKWGKGDITLLVSDGEGSVTGRIPLQVKSWLEVYPAVPLLIACLLLFTFLKIYRKRKTVRELPEISEKKNEIFFTGKLNAYFTLVPEDMEEIPPLTFTLHHIREGKIVVGDMFRNYPELSALLELDHMILYPAENRKIIFYHNSRATVMIGSSIVCRKMQYAIGYSSVIYITSQDGDCELELHYISMV